MKICYVGQLKSKFILRVNPDLDEVIEIKWSILEKLGLRHKDEENSYQHMSGNPYMKKMRLFILKGGHELMDNDHLECAHGQQYLFYSFGKFSMFNPS
jgi:isopentenyldiphosphate isomerase